MRGQPCSQSTVVVTEQELRDLLTDTDRPDLFLGPVLEEATGSTS